MDNPKQNPPLSPEPKREPGHTLTRLLIGSLAFGLDALANRLNEWETLSEKESITTRPAQTPAPEQPTDQLVVQPVREQDAVDIARHAVVGFLFETEDRVSESMRRAGRLAGKAYQLSSKYWRPIARSRIFRPFANRWDALVLRGEYQVETWIDRGRLEEERGLSIARHAVQNSTDEVIDVLAVHPGVRELVEKHSTGFVNEILEEIRERTVSLDTLLERATHKVLRKKSHQQSQREPERLNAGTQNPTNYRASVRK